MAGIIGILVLLLATLTLGGCAGLPNGYGDPGTAGGYAAPYPQPYASGYAAPAPVGIYVPQPVYAPQPYVYGPAYAPAPPPVIVEGSPPPGNLTGLDHGSSGGSTSKPGPSGKECVTVQ